MQIVFDNKKILYTFKRLMRSRSLRISIKRGGEIVITAPFFVSAKQAEKFLVYNIKWVLEKIAEQKEKSDNSIFPSSHKDFLLNKSKALHLVRAKIAKLNAVYNLKYNKVTIKNISSRWGSCSKQGNLNFNYKLVYLGDEIAEYVVAHELCHLAHMNHGRNFWKLVSQTVPHWQVLRKQLRAIH